MNVDCDCCTGVTAKQETLKFGLCYKQNQQTTRYVCETPNATATANFFFFFESSDLYI